MSGLLILTSTTGAQDTAVSFTAVLFLVFCKEKEATSVDFIKNSYFYFSPSLESFKNAKSGWLAVNAKKAGLTLIYVWQVDKGRPTREMPLMAMT